MLDVAVAVGLVLLFVVLVLFFAALVTVVVLVMGFILPDPLEEYVRGKR